MATSKCPSCDAVYEIGEDLCPKCEVVLPPITDQPSRNMTGLVLAGRYDLKKSIGAGAMGAIYLGRHLALERDVCVKVMHPHVAADPKLVRRFHREARAASRLEHPNIIAVLDFGQDTVLGAKNREEDLLYLVMEYVDGIDLSHILAKERRVEPSRAVRMIRNIADALDEAHSKGVVHRDLKPENIMVHTTRDGVESIKVLDFGIAKIMQMDGNDSVTQLTMVGTVCGTPEYMSPEQARGKDMDGRSDLYSLGVLLYQLVTGTVPYDGDSPIEIVTQHLTSAVPNPLSRRPGLPPSVSTLIQNLMLKKPTERPETAAHVVALCDQVLDSIKNWKPSVSETQTDMDLSGMNATSETIVAADSFDSNALDESTSVTRLMPALGHKRRFTSTDSMDLTTKIQTRRGKLSVAFALAVASFVLLVGLVVYKNHDSKAAPERINNIPKLLPRTAGTLVTTPQDTVVEKEQEEVVKKSEGTEEPKLAVVPKPKIKVKPKPKRKATPNTTKPKRVEKPRQPRMSSAERKERSKKLEAEAKSAASLGQTEKAARLYEKAYNFNRANKRLLKKIARLYLRNGSSKACKWMRRYMDSLSPERLKAEKPILDSQLSGVGCRG